jgi:CRISPR type III-B/RAMP module-associated protein Cmr5
MSTLDQRRAQYAWERANRNTRVDGYREMVKGAPALVMGNGLMATLAYYRSRTGSNERAAQLVLDDVLVGWLSGRSYPPISHRRWMPFSTLGRRT